MKVNPHVQNNTQTSRTSQARSSGKGAKDKASSDVPSSKGSEGVSTEISARAREMAMAKKVAMQPHTAREEKIAELKRQIANKEYKVNAEAVADRLVDEHLATGDL